jgi:hypothetical protein
MPVNRSTKEKTIKSETLSMENDFWNVDSIQMFSNYQDMAILPDGFILDEYRDHFENFLENIPLDPKYHYSPTWFAEDYYGTADLDFLVMYFAKVPTLFDFNTPRINVLSKTAMLDLNKLIVEYKDQVKNSKANPKKYVKLDPIITETKGFE